MLLILMGSRLSVWFVLCVMLNCRSYICLVVQYVPTDVESGRLCAACSVLCVCVCFKWLPVQKASKERMNGLTVLRMCPPLRCCCMNETRGGWMPGVAHGFFTGGRGNLNPGRWTLNGLDEVTGIGLMVC